MAVNSHLQIQDFVGRLPPLHRQALEWFFERSNEIHNWPGQVELPAGNTFLASTPKGIYKPHWTHYALSVRQSMDGPYADQIVRRSDDTWGYSYFQEGFEPGDLQDKATNRGLMACLVDQVPIGVFRQVSKRPSRYEILGLAFVATYDGGFFFLEGSAPDGRVRPPGATAEFELLAEANSMSIEEAYSAAPDLVSEVGGRQRVFREILRRRGQQAFREQLLYAYEGACAVSGYEAEDALEAAHIVPYAQQGLSTPRNGLLLRADIHTLFDLGQVAIDPESFRVRVNSRLRATKYRSLEDAELRLPRDSAMQPYRDFLARHAEWARLDGGASRLN